MSKLLTMKGFRRYTPENSIHAANVPHYMDDQGRDWYEWRYNFREDTLKIIYDEDGMVVSFADSAEFMYPMDFAITEIPKSEVPAAFTIDVEHSWHYINGKLVQTANGRDLKIRELREAVLAATDFMVVADYPLDEDNRATLLELRKALRDVTKTDGYPNVAFPEVPPFVLDVLRSKKINLADYVYLRKGV